MGNNTNVVALILAIVALAISAGCIIYVSNIPTPESVDLDGIDNNRVLIDTTKDVAVANTQAINKLRIDMINGVGEVDQDDLDDLEEDLERYCRNEIDDECNCEDGIDYSNEIADLYHEIDELKALHLAGEPQTN